MIIVGLTGSIGMGKSATAAMFREEGIAVHDSDAAVHSLYRGAAVPLIEKHFPGVVTDGMIDRSALGAQVIGKPERMRLLESLIHPLVERSRLDFIEEWRRRQTRMIVADIPLLFEIKGFRLVDVIAVCSAPEIIQKQRVLARPGMTVEKFEAIQAKQVTDGEKRAGAHVVIDTGRGFDYARHQVRALVRALSTAS